jgi:hypothetical protein
MGIPLTANGWPLIRSWEAVPDPSITLRRLTDTLMEVTIEAGGTGSEEAYWRIPLYSKAVAAGFATVSIEPMDSAVTGGTYPYANVIGDPEGVLHVTLQLLGDDPLELEPGDAVTDAADLYLRIHESRANLIGTSPQVFRLVLENGRWFPDGTRGVDTAAMEADTDIQGTDENLVRQLRRVNATTLELTLRSDRFAAQPASMLLPLYFEVPEEGDITLVFFPADAPQDDARFAIGTSALPAPPEPEVTEVTFTIGMLGYLIDGQRIIADVAPYIQPTVDGLGRIMVPVRFVSDATGADEVIWDPVNRKVFVLKGDTEIEMTIGSNALLVNGEVRMMDAVAEIRTSAAAWDAPWCPWLTWPGPWTWTMSGMEKPEPSLSLSRNIAHRRNMMSSSRTALRGGSF